MEGLTERILRGDRRALARGLSLVENQHPACEGILADLHPHRRSALRIGITGPPGVGKSTLVDCLTTRLRRDRGTVGILAIDPSSPFSGGAVLGDRVRMQRHHSDPGVFIRSMASRGQLGGLAPSASDALTLLESAGLDTVVVETAGVGQSEVDIVQLAGTVAVVLAPSLGDDIQAAKAGIMEIADLFVLNKADQPGVEELERQLLAMVSLIPAERDRPEILRTCATTGDGISGLLDALGRADRKHPEAVYWRRFLRERLGREIAELVASSRGVDVDSAAREIAAGRLNPYLYVRETIQGLRRRWME